MREFFNGIKDKLAGIGSDTLNLIMIIIGHCVFLPVTLAILTGLTDRGPSLDTVVLVQTMLMISFIRGIVNKDAMATVIHGLGWFGQGLLLAMIVFK